MLRPGFHSVLRSTVALRTPISRSSLSTSGRRFASTTPADKPRTWKSSATRWGVVLAALYYYNTNRMFAELPTHPAQLPETDRETEIMPTVDELAAQRRQQALASQSASTLKTMSNQDAAPVAEVTSEPGVPAASPQELEEEAEGEGAFNPETGEINWDCPCLGGMAHGPCGEQFKAAFSCFVYSKEEPKGIDCIETFKNMQDCFRQYPEVYGAELEDDGEGEDMTQNPSSSEQSASTVTRGKDTATPAQSADASIPAGDSANYKATEQKPGAPTLRPEEIQEKRQRAKSTAQQVKSEYPVASESEAAVPKAWHDTSSSKDGK